MKPGSTDYLRLVLISAPHFFSLSLCAEIMRLGRDGAHSEIANKIPKDNNDVYHQSELKKKHVRVRVMPIFVVHILFGVARSSESEYSPGSF